MQKQLLSIMFVTAIVVTNTIAAQSSAKLDDLTTILSQLKDQYGTGKQLSFNIGYSYATETNPAVVLDTETANIKMLKSKYYCSVNNTEIFSNDSVSIVLFKEEKIMYLSKNRQHTQFSNPVQLMDSLIRSKALTTFNISASDNTKNVVIKFDQQMMYKELDFTIDTKTGYLKNIKYVVHSEALMDQSENNTEQIKPDSEFSIVNAAFSDYSNEDSGIDQLSANQFYSKEGKDLKVTNAYKDFRIYKASPDL
jgi:hypothetical protein